MSGLDRIGVLVDAYDRLKSAYDWAVIARDATDPNTRDNAYLNRPLKYPAQKCGALLGTFDFHATLSYRELPALFEADFIGLSLVFPHFPRLTLSADGFAPACACA